MEFLTLIVIGGFLWWIADSLDDIKNNHKKSMKHYNEEEIPIEETLIRGMRKKEQYN